MLRRFLTLRGLAPPRGPSWARTNAAATFVTPAAFGRRGLASSPSEPPPPLSERITEAVARARRLAPTAAAALGGTVVIYGAWRILVFVTEEFLALSFLNVFEYGFFAGVGLTTAVVGGTALAYRRNRIAPSAAFGDALAVVCAAPAAEKALGTNIRAGALKAYVAVPAHLAARGGLAWVEPRIQVLFHVFGELGEGMVTAEAVKHRGALLWTVLALDVLPAGSRPAEVFLLRGTEDKLHVRGTLRGFLQTQRAAFVPQDRDASDEALLQEQRALDPAPLK